MASSANEAASARPATAPSPRAWRGDSDRLAQAALRLVPDAPGDEDVVVRAERDEQHRGGERDVVGERPWPQDVLEEVGRQAEGRGEPQDARGDEVERRDERAQEEREQQQVDEDGDHPDALEVVEDGVRDGLLGQRGLAGEAELADAVEPRLGKDPGMSSLSRSSRRSPARRAGRRRARGRSARPRCPQMQEDCGHRAPAAARAGRATPATPGWARRAALRGARVPPGAPPIPVLPGESTVGETHPGGEALGRRARGPLRT